MPFKDINYEQLNYFDEMRHQLRKKIAVINKSSNPALGPAVKLATIELITGKPIQPKTDPIHELLQQQQTAKYLAPVIDKIDSLQDEILDQTAAIETFHTPPLAIEGPTPAHGIDLYERFGFTPEELQYSKQFGDLNGMATANDQGNIQEAFQKLAKRHTNLGRQQGGIKRMKRPTSFHMNRLVEIEEERAMIRKYKDVVGKLSIGKGIPIGKYTIPAKRLKRDNIASVRYTNSNKMVPAFGATKVSDDVKKALLNQKVKQLSIGEKVWLDKLYMNAGQKLNPAKAKVLRGSGVFTSIQEIVERAQVLLGELSAGNTSINLKNELADLLGYLHKHKKIKKTDLANLISAIV